MAQNDSKWPILTDLQLFQTFPTKVAQYDSEWPISPDSQLFQSFPTEVAQNDLEWPISPDLQLFQSFPISGLKNGNFAIRNFSNPPKFRMTRNIQFYPVCNFSNLFPLKWLRMTQNGQFYLIQLFQSFPTEVAQNDSEWPILPDLQLFQSFPTKVAQNDSEWLICNFQSIPTKDLHTFPIYSHRSGSESHAMANLPIYYSHRSGSE